MYMDDQENSFSPSPVGSPGGRRVRIYLKEFIIGFILVVAILAGAAFYIHKLPFSQYLNPVNNLTHPTGYTTSKELVITSCTDIKLAGNALFNRVMPLGDMVFATMRGNINQFSLSSGLTSSASIQLISPKAEQVYNFSVKEENGLVYDGIHLKDLHLSDLKRGQTVEISINCFPKDHNRIRIARITTLSP